MLVARIALFGLSTTVCYVTAAERQQNMEELQKWPEATEILGPSNLLQTKLDGLGLMAPLDSLIAPVLQVGVLNTLDKFVRVLLETLTGLDEISTNDTEFFKGLDGTASLIHMLENIHHTAEAEQPGLNWNATVTKLLDDMQYEVEQLPERTRQDASEMIQELREASKERIQLKQSSGNFLENIASDLGTQLLRVSSSFGPRAVQLISRLGGAGIFQMINDDINAIINDPKMQAAPREILERIGEIGNIAANQRDHVTTNSSFPLSLLESWNRILSLPVELLQTLARYRSEILTNLFSGAVERMNILGIPLQNRSLGPTDSNKVTGNLRSSRNTSSELHISNELQSILASNLSLLSRSAELVQVSAEVIAGTLFAPLNVLLSPLVQLGRDSGRMNPSPRAYTSDESSNKHSPDYESSALSE